MAEYCGETVASTQGADYAGNIEDAIQKAKSQGGFPDEEKCSQPIILADERSHLDLQGNSMGGQYGSSHGLVLRTRIGPGGFAESYN